MTGQNMSIKIKSILGVIPRDMRLPLFITVAFNGVTYFGSRLLTADRPHYDLTNSIDDRVPLVPWTVVIYFGCYLFWIVNYIIGCRQEKEEAYRFAGADLAAKFVCLICFLVFPTTNTRPVIEGSSVWDGLMRLLYQVDAADNLLPSIHCLTSWFCYIAVRKNPRVPGWYRLASLLTALAVCVSTLTTKQHVLADVFTGVALAELSYWFVKRSGFSERYQRICTRISG